MIAILKATPSLFTFIGSWREKMKLKSPRFDNPLSKVGATHDENV
jgi:hypothetical protein